MLILGVSTAVQEETTQKSKEGQGSGGTRIFFSLLLSSLSLSLVESLDVHWRQTDRRILLASLLSSSSLSSSSLFFQIKRGGKSNCHGNICFALIFPHGNISQNGDISSFFLLVSRRRHKRRRRKRKEEENKKENERERRREEREREREREERERERESDRKLYY